MKKYLKFFMLFAIMLLSSAMLFAQEVADTIVATETIDFTAFFATFGTLVAAVPIVMEFLNKLFGKTSETPNVLVQVLSWIVGLIMTMFGWFFNLGFLADITWQYALLYGFGVSLAANGVADTKIIQWIFSLFIKKT